MKKLLGIVVLSLLFYNQNFIGNTVFADDNFDCDSEPKFSQTWYYNNCDAASKTENELKILYSDLDDPVQGPQLMKMTIECSKSKKSSSFAASFFAVVTENTFQGSRHWKEQVNGKADKGYEIFSGWKNKNNLTISVKGRYVNSSDRWSYKLKSDGNLPMLEHIKKGLTGIRGNKDSRRTCDLKYVYKAKASDAAATKTITKNWYRVVKQRDSLDKEVKELKNKILEFDKKIASINSEIKKEKKNSLGLTEKIDSTKNENEQLESKLNSIKEKLKLSENKSQKLQTEKQILKQEIQSLIKENLKLEKEKLEAKKKEEEKKRLEKEKLEAKKKEEEKKRLESLAKTPIKDIKQAQNYINDIQEFIKIKPDEFDILEITEFMINNKEIIKGKWNNVSQDKFNSFKKFVDGSDEFVKYHNIKNEERKQISLNIINSEINKIEEKVAYLKLYLQENLTSNLAEKIVKEIRRTERVIKDRDLDALIQTNNQLELLIDSLDETSEDTSENSNLVEKKDKEKKLKVESKPKKKVESKPKKKAITIRNNKDKIIKILDNFNINYSDIKFSNDYRNFIIYDFEIDGGSIDKVQVEGLNDNYLNGFFEFLTKGTTTYFSKYSGKYFDKIKLSGIKNFLVDGSTVSAKEIGISNLDFKKFDVIKKLINSSSVAEEEKNAISYLMSMSFNNLYYKDFYLEDPSNKKNNMKLESFIISKVNEGTIEKILLKNFEFNESSNKGTFDEILIEKFIFDNTSILSFLNSNTFDLIAMNDFSYILNGLKSLKNFEIKNFAISENNNSLFDVDNVQFSNIKFDYLGKSGKQKIPTSYEVAIKGAESRLSELDPKFKQFADDLNYDAIKFDIGGKWDWNINRNNLLIDINFGISEAATVNFNTSFTGLSTEILELKGDPLTTYLMTSPKIKSLKLSVKDYSLKNRLIKFTAKQQGMNYQQYKDYLTQSINIFVTTFATNNSLATSMKEAVTNFINKSNKITLSIKPSKPLSVTDLIPDFKQENADEIIKKLRLKISN